MLKKLAGNLPLGGVSQVYVELAAVSFAALTGADSTELHVRGGCRQEAPPRSDAINLQRRTRYRAEQMHSRSTSRQIVMLVIACGGSLRFQCISSWRKCEWAIWHVKGRSVPQGRQRPSLYWNCSMISSLNKTHGRRRNIESLVVSHSYGYLLAEDDARSQP